jgi:hypothetical protein
LRKNGGKTAGNSKERLASDLEAEDLKWIEVEFVELSQGSKAKGFYVCRVKEEKKRGRSRSKQWFFCAEEKAGGTDGGALT